MNARTYFFPLVLIHSNFNSHECELCEGEHKTQKKLTES